MSSDFTPGRVVPLRRLGILPINAEPAHSALLDDLHRVVVSRLTGIPFLVSDDDDDERELGCETVCSRLAPWR